MLVSEVQLLKALSPIDVTLFGMFTLVTILLLENARPPIAVTGLPLILLGMSTFGLLPMYFVIVISPFASVKVKREAAGSVSGTSGVEVFDDVLDELELSGLEAGALLELEMLDSEAVELLGELLLCDSLPELSLLVSLLELSLLDSL